MDMRMSTSPYECCLNLLGMREKKGNGEDNYFIVWCLELCGLPKNMLHDETAWCSAIMNGINFILGVERSGSAAAISWKKIGSHVNEAEALIGFDLVILHRSDPNNPNARHVGLFGGYEGEYVKVLGGNQSDGLNIAKFSKSLIDEIRRPKHDHK